MQTRPARRSPNLIPASCPVRDAKAIPNRDWPTIEPLFRLYLLTTGYSSETVQLRVCNVRLFAAWAVKHHVPLTRACHDAVASYLAEQLVAVAQVTARSRLHALRSFFAFCRAEGWREDDPTKDIRIKLPKAQPKRPFTLEEVRAMRDACLNARDRAMVLVFAATGIRVSELLRMEGRDVDWTEGTVLIHGKGAKERCVLLGDTALEALRQYVDGHAGRLWLTRDGKPMKRVLLRDALIALGYRASVRPAGSHRFRVTFANDFLQTGGDLGALQVSMGHSDIKQTAHYAGYNANIRALEHQRRFNLADRL